MSFTLRIFQSEYEEMKNFVLKYPNIETGGDLFGLWKANGDPVVQLIIGPGQDCRRTTVSFHQDTNYLARVGTFVNTSYMLCHIGSWHSHHQLNLNQPSAGDRSTVCNNFPAGLQRYIMIIANIKGSSVAINPYMFTQAGHNCTRGDVTKIPGRSPFRDVGHVLSHITQGAERSLTSEAYLSSVPPDYYPRPSTRSKLTSQATQNSSNRKLDLPVKSNSDYLRIYDQSSLQSKTAHQRTYNILTNDEAQPSPMEVDPPQDYLINQRPQSSRRINPSLNAKSSQLHTNHHKTSLTKCVNYEDTDEIPQWYDTEEGGSMLKKMHQEISETEMARDISYYRDATSKNLSMEFTHDAQTWIITFPKSFDKEPAGIKSSSTRKINMSWNIIKDIRDACKCVHCQMHRVCNATSPSRKGFQPSTSRYDQKAYSTPKQDHPPSPSPFRPDHRQPSPAKYDHRAYSTPNQDRLPSPSRQGRQPSCSRQDHRPHNAPKQDGQPSPRQACQSPTSRQSHQSRTSKQDRYSPYHKESQAKATVKRPTQPWYNTPSGKSALNSVKTDIKTKLSITGSVGVIEESSSKVCLIFFHWHQNWLIEFVSSPKTINLKIITGNDGGKSVAKLTSPEDVVSELQRHCSCPRCRLKTQTPSRQTRVTRPNSRYAAIEVNRAPSRVSSHKKFFATENGEKKFRRICTDINTMFLHGGSVDISRLVNSRQIVLTFNYKNMQWKIIFPFNFPEQLPKLSCIDRRGYDKTIKIRSVEDILPSIRYADVVGRG